MRFYVLCFIAAICHLVAPSLDLKTDTISTSTEDAIFESAETILERELSEPVIMPDGKPYYDSTIIKIALDSPRLANQAKVIIRKILASFSANPLEASHNVLKVLQFAFYTHDFHNAIETIVRSIFDDRSNEWVHYAKLRHNPIILSIALDIPYLMSQAQAIIDNELSANKAALCDLAILKMADNTSKELVQSILNVALAKSNTHLVDNLNPYLDPDILDIASNDQTLYVQVEEAIDQYFAAPYRSPYGKGQPYYDPKMLKVAFKIDRFKQAVADIIKNELERNHIYYNPIILQMAFGIQPFHQKLKDIIRKILTNPQRHLDGKPYYDPEILEISVKLGM